MPIVTFGRVSGIAGRREELVTALAELESAARGEPGCVAYAVGRALEDPDSFTVHGHFADAQALDAHYATPAFATYQRRLEGLLARASVLEVFEVVAASRPVASGPMDPRQAD